MNIIQHPSPNFSLRTEDVRFIILHGTWMKNDKQALKRMCDPKAEVSAHYFIDAQAKVYQLVQDEHTAWHAGVSAWGEVKNLNPYSLGIELSNPGEGEGVDYTDAQYDVLLELLKELTHRYQIPAQNVLGHSDIAPDRKNDPGVHFDWQRLEDVGVARRPMMNPNTGYQELISAGYRGNKNDVLTAFARRCGTYKSGFSS